MLSPTEYLQRAQKIRRDREYLMRRAHSMLDALLKTESAINVGTRANPRAAARTPERVRFFQKELDACRKSLRKLVGGG